MVFVVLCPGAPEGSTRSKPTTKRINTHFYSENKHYFTEVVRQIKFGVQMAAAQIIMYQTYILRRFFSQISVD